MKRKAFLLLCLLALVGVVFAFILIRDREPVIIGDWEVSTAQIDDVNTRMVGEMLHTGPPSFIYDGEYVGLWVLDIHGVGDQFLRLKARLKNNTLWYLHPTNTWMRLAEFDTSHNRFILKQDFDSEKIEWQYHRRQIDAAYFGKPLYMYDPGK